MYRQLVLASLCASILSTGGIAQWSLSGNANANNSSKLGTTNNIHLRLFTNNSERMRIDASSGKVGINSTSPIGRLHVRGSAGSNPSGNWITTGNPIFTGFGEGSVGNGDFILSVASNTSNARPVFIMRRARATLGAPAAVQNNDYLGSFLASGYDGANFQNPATIDFYTDGAPSAGNVPGRISFVTGSNSGNRQERLTIKSNGYVGIGTTAPNNELHVEGRGWFTNGLSVIESGIYSNHTNGDGLEGYANLGYGIGTYGSGYYGAYGSGVGYGVLGTSSDGVGVYGSSFNNNGVYGFSTNSYGGNFESANSWALRAQTTNGTYAGVFYGRVWTSVAYEVSDRNLKQNIKSFGGAMDIINQLKPQHYEFKKDEKYAFLNLPKGSHYGLLAQDVEQVLPNLVSTADHEVIKARTEPGKPYLNGAPKPTATQPAATSKPEHISIKAINYVELIPILVKAIQEQHATIELMKEEISALKNDKRGPVSLSASLGLVSPNPVKGTARIQYQFPESVVSARLLLTDALGRTVKFVQLARSGTTDLDASALAAGVYNCSLVIDGKTAATKRFTVAR